MPTRDDDDPAYDTIGLSQYLSTGDGRTRGPSPRTIERWRTTGYGPSFVKIGRRVVYRRSAVLRWLDRQTRSHTNETRR